MQETFKKEIDLTNFSFLSQNKIFMDIPHKNANLNYKKADLPYRNSNM